MVGLGIPDRGTSTSKDTENICNSNARYLPKINESICVVMVRRLVALKFRMHGIESHLSPVPPPAPTTSYLAKFLDPTLLSFASEPLHMLFLLPGPPSSTVISWLAPTVLKTHLEHYHVCIPLNQDDWEKNTTWVRLFKPANPNQRFWMIPHHL